MANHSRRHYVQSDRQQYFALLDRYQTAVGRLRNGEAAAKRDFIWLSMQLHTQKGLVPKRLWPLIGTILRGAVR